MKWRLLYSSVLSGRNGLPESPEPGRLGHDGGVAELRDRLVGSQGAGLTEEPTSRNRYDLLGRRAVDLSDGGVDAVDRELRLEEVPENDAVLISHEIRLTRLSALPAENEALHGVVDVGDVSNMPASVNPSELACLRRGGETLDEEAFGAHRSGAE